MLQSLAAIVASGIGLLFSLGMLVMLMAGLANAKEAQIQQGKWMMLGVAIVQVVALGLAIWWMVQRRPWPAAAAGFSPVIVVVVLVAILVKIEW